MVLIQIQIKNYEDLEKFKRNARIAKAAMPSYRLWLLRSVAEDIVLQPIHQYMRSLGVSEKIIDGTKMTKAEMISKRKARVWIVSRYFNGSFDVAVGRHEGTKRTFLRPKNNRPNPHLRWWDKSKGRYLFSKGHWRKGVPRLLYVSKIIAEKKEEFPAQFNLEMEAWVSKMLEVKTKLSY